MEPQSQLGIDMNITFTRTPTGDVTYTTDEEFDKAEYGVQAEFMADCHTILNGIDLNLWKADFEAGDATDPPASPAPPATGSTNQ
jgi:hypothetical protein